MLDKFFDKLLCFFGSHYMTEWKPDINAKTDTRYCTRCHRYYEQRKAI